MTTPRTAAFFDLDETLLAINSARLWARHMWQRGEVRAWDMARFSLYLVRYKLALIDIERVTEQAVGQLEGQVEAELRQKVHDWYDTMVRQHIYTEARDLIERHRSQNHDLILLTAATPYISEKVIDELDLHAYLCTHFEVDPAGVFTGRYVDPLCYGAGKIHWAERCAAERNIDLDASFFYTDSYTDLPMLRRVGHPIATNPDPRLRRLAAKEGMEILDFRA